MKAARLLSLPLIAALASCGGQTSDAERKTSAGQVLGGSISDEMLPLDTVTSQSPPLREQAKDGSPSAAGERRPRTGDEPEAEDDDAEPEPTPSATPTSPADETE